MIFYFFAMFIFYGLYCNMPCRLFVAVETFVFLFVFHLQTEKQTSYHLLYLLQLLYLFLII
jgi:hypothetical protein